MGRIEDLEQDVLLFLNNFEELSREGKKDLLMTMFKKHLVLNSSELVLSKHDLHIIVSDAKDRFSKDPMPIFIDGKKIEHNELVNMFVAEATISLLNQKGALNRLPKFNRS